MCVSFRLTPGVRVRVPESVPAVWIISVKRLETCASHVPLMFIRSGPGCGRGGPLPLRGPSSRASVQRGRTVLLWGQRPRVLELCPQAQAVPVKPVLSPPTPLSDGNSRASLSVDLGVKRTQTQTRAAGGCPRWPGRRWRHPGQGPGPPAGG